MWRSFPRFLTPGKSELACQSGEKKPHPEVIERPEGGEEGGCLNKGCLNPWFSNCAYRRLSTDHSMCEQHSPPFPNRRTRCSHVGKPVSVIVRPLWCNPRLPCLSSELNLAVGQNQWYHFGVGEFTTHFSLFYWGLGRSLGITGILTHGHLAAGRRTAAQGLRFSSGPMGGTALASPRPGQKWLRDAEGVGLRGEFAEGCGFGLSIFGL